MKLFHPLAALLVCLLCFFSHLSAAELAVIPYKLERLDGSMKESTGDEYAKYVGIASVAGRKIGLYKQYQLQRDMRGLGISPASVISMDECALICRRRMISYLISGTVYAVEEGFAARSFLYSASHNSIISKSYVKASTLGELAEKDVRSLFQFDMQSRKDKSDTFDSIVLLDTSYNMSEEIEGVKKGLISHYSRLLSDWPGSRIFIQTYNASEAIPAPVTCTAPIKLKRSIQGVSLRGGGSDESMRGAMSSMLSNVSWRRSSKKYALIVTNSNVKNPSSLIRFTNRASAKKIPFHIVGGARVDRDSYTAYSGMASQTGGSITELAYHQLFRDQENREFHLYYQSGRLYSSTVEVNSWRFENGLDSARQEFVSGKLLPYNLEKYFKEKMDGVVISRNRLENSAEHRIEKLFERYSRGGGTSTAGRVLFEELGATIWADIDDRRAFVKFQQMKSAGTSFLLGVRIVQDARSPYGYTFHSRLYITDLGVDDVPSDLIIPLKRIIANPAKYAEEGFLNPPLYFVNVKVAEYKSYSDTRDIRSN